MPLSEPPKTNSAVANKRHLTLVYSSKVKKALRRVFRHWDFTCLCLEESSEHPDLVLLTREMLDDEKALSQWIERAKVMKRPAPKQTF